MVLAVIFCCSHSGLVFHFDICFSDEAWRLLPGKRQNKLKKTTELKKIQSS